MHLYGATIASITWDDVDRFCQQGTAENTYLDYKTDFPSDLAKSIAAMANTLGGIILIGVDETDDGKPRLPLLGIDNDRGLDERVLNTILDSMTPPVIPEIVTCPNAAGDKAVMVIRIPQSESAPHALHRNTSVYIRTGKRNKPEGLADLGRIEWMRNRRKKSEDLRELIFDRACERFRDMRDGLVVGVPRTEELWPLDQEQPALLTISLCPLYPEEILVEPVTLDTVRRKIRVKDHVGTGHEFPLPDTSGISRMVEDGFVMHASAVGPLRTYHTHLNMYGLFLFRQSLFVKPEDKPIPHPLIRGYEILCRLYQVVGSGAKFYGEIGYRGPLKFRVRLEGLLGVRLWMPDAESQFRTNSEYVSADHHIDTAQVIRSAALQEEPHRAVLTIAERIGWAFNHPITLEWLKSFHAFMKMN